MQVQLLIACLPNGRKATLSLSSFAGLLFISVGLAFYRREFADGRTVSKRNFSWRTSLVYYSALNAKEIFIHGSSAFFPIHRQLKIVFIAIKNINYCDCLVSLSESFLLF